MLDPNALITDVGVEQRAARKDRGADLVSISVSFADFIAVEEVSRLELRYGCEDKG